MGKHTQAIVADLMGARATYARTPMGRVETLQRRGKEIAAVLEKEIDDLDGTVIDPTMGAQERRVLRIFRKAIRQLRSRNFE